MDNCGQQWYRFSMSSISSNEQSSWELAGFTDAVEGLLGTSGLLIETWGQPLRPRIEGDLLVHDYWWPEDYDENPGRDKWETSVVGMLDAFIRLTKPQDVVRFAERWGVLGLCEHLVPAIHNSPGMYGMSGCKVLGPPKTRYYWEPLESWFFYARTARSVLNAAAALQAGHEPPVELMDELKAWISTVRQEPDLPPLDWWVKASAAEHLELLVNFWLHLGGVKPRIRLSTTPPTFAFRVGAFGAIGMQLMQSITRTQGLTLCSSCGYPYPRSGRRVQAGRRNYCPTCGRTAALRDAQRNYAERKKGRRNGQTES